MDRKKKIYLCIAAALLALGITVYPLVSNRYNEKHQSMIQAQYAEAVEQLDNTALEQARKASQDYNATLLNSTVSPYSKEALEEASESYDELLNINSDSVMGTVELPELGVVLPIYHGTDEDTLAQGAGHLLGSSLPVGGLGCHSVISAHSGLAGRKYFSDLDQVEIGDIFYLHILDETLAYMVLDINKVLPEDTSELAIDPVRDSCTLVTCTPYGVNTHRLLVRGERISVPMAERTIARAQQNGEERKSTWTSEYLHGIAYGILGIAGLFLISRALRWYIRIMKQARAEMIQEKKAKEENRSVSQKPNSGRAKGGRHEAK